MTIVRMAAVAGPGSKPRQGLTEDTRTPADVGAGQTDPELRVAFTATHQVSRTSGQGQLQRTWGWKRAFLRQKRPRRQDIPGLAPSTPHPSQPHQNPASRKVLAFPDVTHEERGTGRLKGQPEATQQPALGSGLGW